MNICDLQYQNKIIKIVDDYFYDLDDVADFKITDLEDLISSRLKLNFNFSLVSDNKAIIDHLQNTLQEEAPGIALSIDKATPARSNIIKNISSYTIDDLFHGLETAKAEFEIYSKSEILGHGLLARGNIAGVKTNEDITQNFMNLKSKLFTQLQNFLRDKGVYNDVTKPLYKEGVPNYNHYVQVMRLISDYFFNSGIIETRQSYTGKTILALPLDTSKHKQLFKAYYNAVLLSNFDSIIDTKFKNLFKVNINQFNILENNLNLNKYSTSFSTASTLYWKGDSHASDSAEKGVANLTKDLVSVVPLYTKKNNLTPRFMGPNDLYLIGAKISNFELKYGNKIINDQESGIPKGDVEFKYFNNNSLERIK